MGTFGDDDFVQMVAAFEAAPFEAGQWAQALDLFADAAGGWAGQLIGVTPATGELAWNVITQMPADATAEWERRGGAMADMNPRASSLHHPPFRVSSDRDYLTPADQARSAFYQELFVPMEAPHISVGRLGQDQRMVAVICAIRTARQGPASAADHARIAAILPHVDAALAMQLRLDARDIQAAIGPLDALAIPAFLCNMWGRPVAMTAAADALLRQGDLLTLQGRRLTTRERARDAMIQRALRLAGTAWGAGRSVVRATAIGLVDAAGLVRRVDIAPLPRGMDGFPSSASCILAVSQPRPTPDAAMLLQQAFGFTPAEAATALYMGHGLSSAEIAQRRSVSIATARVQVNAVLQKAGVRKASMIAAMLGQLNL